jgi:hypothetical protein
MNDLLPGKKRFTMRDKLGKFSLNWRTGSLDWTAKVVCEPCNGGWMSRIENEHAKPAMTDLILGSGDVNISQRIARSIALFAFKTAVVFDFLQRDRPPFFRRSLRHRFRESLEIPPGVRMWMAAYLPQATGAVNTGYWKSEGGFAGPFELYTCTYAVGHFIFQVCAERWPIRTALVPWRGFEQVSIPFWPTVPDNAVWPPSAALGSEHFEKFAMRWNEVEPWLVTGRS